MEITVYNQEGKKIGKIALPKEIFGLKLNPDLVHQVIVSQMANQRQKVAHTKTRAEVRGGGRKPWAQKGTGRARHGSIRSPIWKGGGVVFGPRKEKNFKKKIPKKMKRKALLMVLSVKAKENLLTLLENLKIEKGKTREIFEVLKKLPGQGKSVLLALPQYDKKIIRAVKNLPKVTTLEAKDLNVLDLLSFKYLVMPKESIKIIKETFLKN